MNLVIDIDRRGWQGLSPSSMTMIILKKFANILVPYKDKQANQSTLIRISTNRYKLNKNKKIFTSNQPPPSPYGVFGVWGIKVSKKIFFESE